MSDLPMRVEVADRDYQIKIARAEVEAVCKMLSEEKAKVAERDARIAELERLTTPREIGEEQRVGQLKTAVDLVRLAIIDIQHDPNLSATAIISKLETAIIQADGELLKPGEHHKHPAGGSW